MVSIVVPAYNEEKTLYKCLDALCAQKTKRNFEIIVVDNNSTDKTADVIKDYAKRSPVRYVLETQKGAGAARYRGFEEAKGAIILTTDADAIVPGDWIDRMVDAIDVPGVSAVTSPCTIDDKSVIKQQLFLVGQAIGYVGFYVLRGHRWMAGFSFGVKKDLYIKSGKINKELPNLDDIELSERMIKLGRIVSLPDLHVICSSRRFRTGLVRGLLSYLKPFFQMTYLGKKASMQDYR